jgi:hypothetical protein
MRSLWARVVYIFNFLIFSPNEEGRGGGQYPLPGQHPQSVLEGNDSGGPIFRPPTAPSWSDLECNYTAMTGYRRCSTDGDRSCWLEDKKGGNTTHDYTIKTNYEHEWPIGITRKAST